MKPLSPCIVLKAYFKRLRGDLQNDLDLDLYCQALVAEIEQLKRTSGHNAVIPDRSGQRTGQEEGGDDDDVIQHEFIPSRSTGDQMAAVGP
jgi:hypothetical protein